MDSLYMKTVRFYVGVLSHCLNHPHFNTAYLQQEVVPLAVDQQRQAELIEYMRLSTRHHIFMIVLGALNLSVCLRVAIFGLMAIFIYKIFDPTANIEPIQPNIYQINCVRTNCTQPPVEAGYGLDLSKLPIFSMCSTTLTHLLDRVQYLDSFGVFLFTLGAASALLATVIFPLWCRSRPCRNSMLMHLMAPKITAELLHNRAIELLHLNDHSMRNYCNALNVRIQDSLHYNYCGAHLAPVPPTMMIIDRLVSSANSHHSATATVCSAAHEHDHKQDDPLLDRIALDCLPIVRTSWWINRAAKALFWLWLEVNLTIMALLTGIYLHTSDVLYDMRHKMAQYDGWMRRVGCSVWHEHQHQQQQQDPAGTSGAMIPIKLADIIILSNVKSYYWMVAFRWLPSMIHGCLFTEVIATSFELRCWMYEIKFKLKLAVQFAHQCQMRSAPIAKNSTDSLVVRNPPARTNNIDFELLRQQLKETTNVRMLIIEGNRPLMSVRSDLELEKFLFGKLAKRGDCDLDESRLGELMENIYISLRLFICQVDELAPSVRLLCFSMIGATYALLFFGIWISKSSQDTFVVSSVSIITSLTCSMGLIFGAAVFQAHVSCCLFKSGTNLNKNCHYHHLTGLAASFNLRKAKKLHPLIWSLLAETSHSIEIRTSHIRALWLKQIEQLEAQGGIAFNYNGLRLSYVNMLQASSFYS